jgi:hypothetical protein
MLDQDPKTHINSKKSEHFYLLFCEADRSSSSPQLKMILPLVCGIPFGVCLNNKTYRGIFFQCFGSGFGSRQAKFKMVPQKAKQNLDITDLKISLEV